MRRLISIFSAFLLMVANIGSAQSITNSSSEDHNVYPLIIALVILVIAITTRLITLSQSRKQGNSI